MGLDFGGSGNDGDMQWSGNPLKSLAAPSRRYSDKRRYTSKVAARERRSVESDLLHDLGRSLPITQFALNSLDKISILRLAVTNLKLRTLFGNTSKNGSTTSALALPDDLLNGGFLIVLSASGDVIYVSDSISECLGLTSYEVIGKSIYDYATPDDRGGLNELLMADDGLLTPPQRSALIRLKCNLFPHMNPLHFRPVSNKVIHFTGKMYVRPPFVKNAGMDKGRQAVGPCFIGVGRTIPHPADNNYPFPSVRARVFTSLHSITNLAFIRADPRVEEILRFTPSELINQKGLDFVHGEDSLPIMGNVHDLHTKGQTLTKPYRFLAKGGGWVWMVSECSTLFTNSYRANAMSTTPASAVFCRNIVISEIQTDQILSLLQLPLANNSERAMIEEIGVETDSGYSGNDSDSSAYSPSPGMSPPVSEGRAAVIEEQLMNLPPAGLFQEFLSSGSDSDSDTNSVLSPGEHDQTATTQIKDEIFEVEDLTFFGSLDDADGCDLDFTALPPEIASALDELFVAVPPFEVNSQPVSTQFVPQETFTRTEDVKPYINDAELYRIWQR